MKIDHFKPFDGQHCETTATGTLLQQIGIELSEPMLFGLGEGLGFIYWNMKIMDFPFIGGRIKPDLLTKNITKNLNLELLVKETSSKQKAWEEVKEHLDSGQAVGLKWIAIIWTTFPIRFILQDIMLLSMVMMIIALFSRHKTTRRPGTDIIRKSGTSTGCKRPNGI